MSYYPVALSMCVHIHLHYLRALHFFSVVMTTIWVFFHIMLRLQSDARFPYAFLFFVIPSKNSLGKGVAEWKRGGNSHRILLEI